MGWLVRNATQADVPAVARVNVAAWRNAYRGIVPDSFLDGMEVARRQQGWARWVALPPPDAVFVATGDGGDVVAYCAVCAVRESGDAHPALPTGELAAIYVDPSVLGSGAGHAVHEAGVASLVDAGFRHAVLWVFEDNAGAREFYERHGWTSDGVRTELEVGDARPMEVRYSRRLP
jgi:ribosomal protein S18 acetylase RimI-like enzyme